jgi:hypothetical protein
MIRLVLAFLLLVVHPAFAASSYFAIEIPQPASRSYTVPVSINEIGEIAANTSFSKAAYAAGIGNAVYWQNSSSVPVIMDRDPTGAVTNTKANNMNNNGAIVGEFRDAVGKQRLALWNRGVWRFFASVQNAQDPATQATRGYGVNDNGDIVGEVTLSTGPSWALQFRSVLGYQHPDDVLNPFTSAPRPLTKNEKAVNINNRGLIVGETQGRVFFIDAYGQRANVFTDLRLAVDVNERSHILAHFQNGCYIYDRATGANSNLLAFSNAACLGAALNDNNDMVGSYELFSFPGQPRAFVYHYDIPNNIRQFFTLDTITLFNQPNVILTHAADINNAGQIIAGGYVFGTDDPNVVKRLYLLIPSF